MQKKVLSHEDSAFFCSIIPLLQVCFDLVRFEGPACRNDFIIDDQCRRTHDAIAGDLGKVRDILDFGVNPQMLYGFFRSSQEGFTFATATA